MEPDPTYENPFQLDTLYPEPSSAMSDVYLDASASSSHRMSLDENRPRGPGENEINSTAQWDGSSQTSHNYVPLPSTVSASSEMVLKTYSCPSCGIAFTGMSARQNLWRHKHWKVCAVERKSLECKLCGLSFGRDDAFKRHEAGKRHRAMLLPRQVSRIKSRSLLQEHCIELKLDCLTVMAFPDTCSSANVISEQFLHGHDIGFDDQHRHTLKLPNGKQLHSLGTADLTFRIGDDDSLYVQSFTVIRNCVHDIILGNRFLRKIELFTKFSNHLKWVPRIYSARTSRVRLVESPQQAVTGSIDGHFVSAAPDTGSDVNLISMEYAEKIGLQPITDSRGVINLEFIDGSTALTCGLIEDIEWKFDKNEEAAEKSSQQRTLAKSRPAIVRDWNFGTNATTTDVYVCDFYVLENLTIPIILSSDLLLGSNAFKACARNFRPFVQPTKRLREPEDADIWYIRTQNKRRSWRSLFRHESANAPQPPATHNPDQAAFDNEVRRRGDEADRIAELPPNERAAAQDAENQRIQRWDLHQQQLQAGNVQQPSQQPPVQQSSTQAQSLPAQSQLQPQPPNAGP